MITGFRAATFLEILETRKCLGDSANVREMSGKRSNVGKSHLRSGNLCIRGICVVGELCSQGNLIVAAHQNDLPVLYLYCNSFFIRDVRTEFRFINMHLLGILPAVSSGMCLQQFPKNTNVRFSADVFGQCVPCSGTGMRVSTLSKLGT